MALDPVVLDTVIFISFKPAVSEVLQPLLKDDLGEERTSRKLLFWFQGRLWFLSCVRLSHFLPHSSQSGSGKKRQTTSTNSSPMQGSLGASSICTVCTVHSLASLLDGCMVLPSLDRYC